MMHPVQGKAPAPGGPAQPGDFWRHTLHAPPPPPAVRHDGYEASESSLAPPQGRACASSNGASLARPQGNEVARSNSSPVPFRWGPFPPPYPWSEKTDGTGIFVYVKWQGGNFALGDDRNVDTRRYYVENITKFIQNLDEGRFEGIPATRDEYGFGNGGGYHLLWGKRILAEGADYHPRDIGMSQDTELTLCYVRDKYPRP